MEREHVTTSYLEQIGVEIRKIEQLALQGATPGFSLAIITPEKFSITSFGYLSNRKQRKVGNDTKYDLASITKLFTAGQILKLHQEQKLSIYDRCSDYLENFVGSNVKLIDLLTHHVNFGVGLSYYRNKFKNKFGEEIIKIKPPRNPSERVIYASLCFLYLGKIIEEVEEEDFDLVIKRFANSLGLFNTTTGVDIGKIKHLAPPTEIIDGVYIQGVTHDESARLLGGVAGSAGIFATASDLALFGKAWLDGKIVDHSFLENVVFMDYDKSGESPQALGWWLRTPIGGGKNRHTRCVYSHTGFTGSFLAINPSKSLVCAFVCNRTLNGRDNQKHREIWDILIDWISD